MALAEQGYAVDEIGFKYASIRKRSLSEGYRHYEVGETYYQWQQELFDNGAVQPATLKVDHEELTIDIFSIDSDEFVKSERNL